MPLRICLERLLQCFDDAFTASHVVSNTVPPQVKQHQPRTGILTSNPSATLLQWQGTHLRVASPAHDERGCGNLGHSELEILTPISLLMPAFSLLIAPVTPRGLPSTHTERSLTTSYISKDIRNPKLRYTA